MFQELGLKSPVPDKPQQESDLMPRNSFDRMKWSGAFGDFVTLIPFVVGYIGVLKLGPFGVLFAFGDAMVVCGAYYKTPYPVKHKLRCART